MIRSSSPVGHKGILSSFPFAKADSARPLMQAPLAGSEFKSGKAVSRMGIFGNFAASFRSLVQNFQRRPMVATVAGLSPLLLGAQEAFAAEPKPLISDQGVSQILIVSAIGAVFIALARHARREKALAVEKVATVVREAIVNPSTPFDKYLEELNEENLVGINSRWYLDKYLPAKGIQLKKIEKELVHDRVFRLCDTLDAIRKYEPETSPSKYLADRRKRHQSIIDDESQLDPEEKEIAQLWLYAIDYFKADFDRSVAAP